MAPVFRALCALAAVAVPGPVLAADQSVLSCRFDTLCSDTEGCSPTDYRLAISYVPKTTGPQGMAARATVADGAGDRTGLITIRGEVIRFLAGETFEGQEESLTAAASGAARLVVTDIGKPTVLLYAGTCTKDA